MSRTDTEIKKHEGVDANYLTKYIEGDQSLAAMDEYRTLPRHKTIQSTTALRLKDEFGEGSIILQPGDVLLWHRGDEPFTFIPVLFFVEWLIWADLKDSQTILGRTMDPTSEIAKKAKDPKRRVEVYDGHEERSEAEQWHKRYVQAFRFVGIIYDTNHPLHETLLTLSFERGEFFTGQNLINAIKMRKIPITLEEKDEEGNPIVKSIPVPLYAQMWKVEASLRDRAGNKWYGLDVHQMEELVPENLIEEMRILHLDMKKAKDADRIIVEEGPVEDNDPAKTPETPF